LYLPKAWIEDPERRAEAKIPRDIQLETKPEQARAMLIEAWERGAPMRWVTGDEVYGNASALREAIATRGRQYVFAVSSSAPIWRKRPKMVRPQTETGGRPQQNARVSARHMTVAEVVSRWPSKKWRTITSSQGAKGPIRYDWAAERVVERVDDLPGRDAWLVARRSLSDHTDVAYYLSNADKSESLETMVQVAAQRYRIEQCFEEAKGETGLDQYEVRHFQSWYRHITLSMMAHAWLAVTRAEANERGASEIPQKKMAKSL
jgi:SRSO17 transposase